MEIIDRQNFTLSSKRNCDIERCPVGLTTEALKKLELSYIEARGLLLENGLSDIEGFFDRDYKGFDGVFTGVCKVGLLDKLRKPCGEIMLIRKVESGQY